MFTESPRFISKPSHSMTVKEKQNVTLPCKATGFPPPIITWYKNGHMIEEERKHFKKRNLEIKNILYEDHGIYTCTAENLLGRVKLSVNITVKGRYSIKITKLISQALHFEPPDLVQANVPYTTITTKNHYHYHRHNHLFICRYFTICTTTLTTVAAATAVSATATTNTTAIATAMATATTLAILLLLLLPRVLLAPSLSGKCHKSA